MTAFTPTPEPARAEPVGGMTAPRLQLRWARPVEGDPGWGTPQTYLAQGEGGHQRWICHYELVLPLRKHDIRREREGAPDVEELVVPISKTRRGSYAPPDDAPYRDGAHAAWDATQLGDLPVYVLPIAGPFVKLSSPAPAPDAGLAEVDRLRKHFELPDALSVSEVIDWTLEAMIDDQQRLADVNLYALQQQESVAAQAATIATLRAERDRFQADAAGRGEGVKVLRKALERIERWNGEFPETGKFWNGNKEPMSYAAAYGSNGERDFMRAVARDALAAGPNQQTVLDWHAPTEDDKFKVAVMAHGGLITWVGGAWHSLMLSGGETRIRPLRWEPTEVADVPGLREARDRAHIAAAPAPATDGTGGQSDGV